MRFVKVLVERSEHLSIPVILGEWEVPILQMIHGVEKVKLSGEFIDLDRELPSAEAEFDRLSNRYGADVKTEQPFVSMVYGQPPMGTNGLAAAIAKSQLAVPVEDDPTA